MAGSEVRSPGLRIAGTVILALIFAILPLPGNLEVGRPHLLLLLVIYWSLSAPRIAGLMFAWFCGLALDLLQGPLLGQHAAAFLFVAFLTHKFQLRIRVFPIYHQTLTVFMMLTGYEFLLFWIDGIIGQPVTTWMRWLPVLTSTILWPILSGVMDVWNGRNR